MSADLLALLEEVDASHPDRLEFPKDINWAALMARVEKVVPICERITGQSFHIDRPQDASYCAEVRTIYQVGNVLIVRLGVRFSNFGDLCTVTLHRKSPAAQSMVDAIVVELWQLGFHYVDEETLQQPYTGVIKALKDPELGSKTWFGRFFNYT